MPDRNYTRTFAGTRVNTYSNAPAVYTAAPTLSTYYTSTWVEGNKQSPNPYNFTKIVESSPPGYFSTAIGPSWSRVSGPDAYSLNPGQYSSPDMLSEAYNKALSSMYEELRGSLDLSVALAESGKTLKMLKSMASVVSYTRGFAASSRKHLVKGTVKNTSGRYLEYIYGVKPLLQDLFGIADEIVNPKVSGLVLVQGKGRYIDNYDKHGFAINNIPMTWGGERSDRVLIRCRFKPKPSSLTTLGRFASLNPASIAWELTPYSFVVDWFLNIGGYLRSAESAFLYNSAFHSGFVTKTSRMVQKAYASGASKVGETYTVLNQEKLIITSTLRRTVLSSAPFPALPRVNLDLSVGRAVKSAALIAQFLKDPLDIKPKARWMYIPVSDGKPFAAQRLFVGAASLSDGSTLVRRGRVSKR